MLGLLINGRGMIAISTVKSSLQLRIVLYVGKFRAFLLTCMTHFLAK